PRAITTILSACCTVLSLCAMTYSIMSEAELLRENNGRGWVESCGKRRGAAEMFTQLETWPRLLFGREQRWPRHYAISLYITGTFFLAF
ncbi:hypothetical protein V8C86DRAFT_2858419, partial [Haematococcus lacustris]